MLGNEILQSIQLVAFDFDGVFTDNSVWVNEDGVESVRCNRSDGFGLARLKSVEVQPVIISSETNKVVSKRAEKLDILCKQGVKNKEVALKEVCGDLGIPIGNTMFIGNDINDIPALQAAGVPVAVADAYSEVLPYVVLTTKTPGGLGAVREICDMIYNAKQASK